MLPSLTDMQVKSFRVFFHRMRNQSAKLKLGKIADLYI